MNFYSELIKELLISSKNNFSEEENYDHVRFGIKAKPPITLNGIIRKKLENVFNSKGFVINKKDENFEDNISLKIKEIDPYLDDLEKVFNLISDNESKNLMIKVLAFRMLGFTKVKLPLSTPEYWKGIDQIEEIANNHDFIRSKFMGWSLPLVDLDRFDLPIKLYFLPFGIYADFFVKQYEFKNVSKTIKAESGEYVIDAGGCWGDTALYFANEVGKDGKVFTFEFIPSNIEILIRNINLNPVLKERISVIQNPIWENSKETVFYTDNGPGSRVFLGEEAIYDGKVSSLSIDDFVNKNSIQRIDFIKMDIEGAEPYALKGAKETIKRFKPKLAIAIYHSLNDFVNIPMYINELDLGYEFHFAHCSIHEEESILFAEIPN